MRVLVQSRNQSDDAKVALRIIEGALANE